MYMDPLDIGRWQFGITTVYHFFMVPLTLGLGMVVTFLYLRYIFTKKRRIQTYDEVLGKALPHQLRNGCGNRFSAGIPVWYGLE